MSLSYCFVDKSIVSLLKLRLTSYYIQETEARGPVQKLVVLPQNKIYLEEYKTYVEYLRKRFYLFETTVTDLLFYEIPKFI